MATYENGTVSVGTTAKLIVTTGNQNDGVLVQNRGPVPVHIGGSGVTANGSGTDGVLLAPGERDTVSTVGNVETSLYGITAAGTATVAWIQVEG